MSMTDSRVKKGVHIFRFFEAWDFADADGVVIMETLLWG